jgi:ribosome production factor 1
MSDNASSKSGAEMYSDEEGVSVDMGEEKEKNNDPAAVEERRKGKRMEKLEKRIKAL